MNRNISDKDKKDWENFLSSEKKLPNKDLDQKKKKIRRAVKFDLHGYSLDEANKKIHDLIYQSFNNEVKRLIIVTGKGLHSQNVKDPYISKDLGILKNSVRDFINRNTDLMDMISQIQDANITDGGSGAFYIYLKKKSIK